METHDAMPVPSRWTLALSAFGLGVLVALGAAGATYFAATTARWHRPPPPPPPPVYARDEFSHRIMGKPEAEVITAVGKPDDTTVDNDATYWHFKKRTRDPLTGDLDSDVQVVIKEGKVANINY